MYVLGIHPDGDYFKVALLKNSGKKSRIVFLQEFKKDILDLNQLKRKLLKETRYKQENVETVSALTPEEIFVKTLTFPFTRKSSVMKALPFQMEKLLPFSEEHVTTIAQIRAKKSESTVTLYTFFNDTLQSHLQDIKTLGFDSDTVSTVAKALARFKTYFAKETAAVTLLYFGWEKSYLIFVDGDEIKHSLSVDVGFRMFIDAARQDYPGVENVDFSFLKNEIKRFFKNEIDRGEIKDVLLKFQRGLFRAFEFLKKKENLDHVDIIHLGYSVISEEMTQNMGEGLTNSVDISPHLEFDRQEIKSYAIEIGLALDAFEKNQGSLQFRTGEFASAKQLARIKRKIKSFLGLSFICTVVTFAITTLVFIKKESVIRERFNYITTLGGEEPKSYPLVQKLFFSKAAFQKEMDHFLEKVKWHKQEGGFLKEPFLVSEFLQSIKNEVNPREISYELISYPSIDKPKELYTIKLSILFDAQSVDRAQEIFENLKLKVEPIEKSLNLVKEKNGYQMVFIIR